MPAYEPKQIRKLRLFSVVTVRLFFKCMQIITTDKFRFFKSMVGCLFRCNNKIFMTLQ